MSKTRQPPPDWSPQWVAWVLGGLPRAVLTRRELAALLGKAERTVQRYTDRNHNALRSVRLSAGRTSQVHYNLADVRRFLGLDSPQ